MLYETRILRKIREVSGNELSISFNADGAGSVKIDSMGNAPEFKPFFGLNDLHKFLEIYLVSLEPKPQESPYQKQSD